MTDPEPREGCSAPTVSVVLTTFQRPHLVTRSAESVLRQTFGDLELIIVDDASGDDTAAVLDCLISSDERVSVLTHEVNRGPSAARNTGIAAANGRFVAFQDDDDEWREDKLALQVELLDREPAVDVATCFEEWRRADGTVVARDLRLDGNVHRRLAREDLVHMQTLLVRRDALDRVGGFDERLRHHEDMDMALRLSRQHRFATVPQRLQVFNVTAHSLSTNVDNRLAALRTMLSEHPEMQSPRVRSIWHYRLGRYEAERGAAHEWRQELLRSIRCWPLNGRALVGIVIGTFAGPRANVRLAAAKNRLMRRARLFSSR